MFNITGFFKVLLLIFLIVGCSSNSIKSKNPIEKKVEPQTLLIAVGKEIYHLLVNLPSGWNQVFDNKTEKFFIKEYIPIGQNLASWKDMITVRVDGIAVPADYALIHSVIEETSVLNNQTCKNFKRSDFVDYEQSGIKTVEYYIECPESSFTPGIGEFVVYKYILAGEKIGLITVWRSWKIVDESDLIRARSEKDEFICLARQINLKNAKSFTKHTN